MLLLHWNVLDLLDDALWKLWHCNVLYAMFSADAYTSDSYFMLPSFPLTPVASNANLMCYARSTYVLMSYV